VQSTKTYFPLGLEDRELEKDELLLLLRELDLDEKLLRLNEEDLDLDLDLELDEELRETLLERDDEDLSVINP
jgi:hypothetical protein